MQKRFPKLSLSVISIGTLLLAGCTPEVAQPKAAASSTKSSTAPAPAAASIVSAVKNTSDATKIQPTSGERPVSGQQIQLKTDNAVIVIHPSTLQFQMGVDSQSLETISEAQPAMQVRNVKANGTSASWEIPTKGLTVVVQVVNKCLEVKMNASKQTSITWPVLGKDNNSTAMLLPLAEGRYVPTHNQAWIQFLTKNENDELNNVLSMPFWGVQGKNYTMTYRVDNPFNDDVQFANDDSQLGMGITHDFTQKTINQPYGMAVYLGGNNPDEPAEIYRQTLIDNHQFVTLSEKIKRNPSVQKLLGSAFVYLWGSDEFSPEDVKNWVTFAKSILQASTAAGNSPGKRIWQLLSKDDQDTISQIVSQGYADNYQKTQLTEDIGTVLDMRNFYQKAAWQHVDLDTTAKNLLQKPISSLNETSLYQLNDELLYDAFPGQFSPVPEWGDGVSTQMVNDLHSAGLNHLWLGLSDWEMGYRHPQFVKQAESLGYLVATYDSYTTVQDPQNPANSSFDTALFNESLYKNGAIVNANGTKVSGFQGQGYATEPTIMMPYVKQRFASIMNNIKFNSWFVDSDGDATFYEDYSKTHPATEQQQMNAIIQRLQFFDNQNMVVGTEEGNWFSASSVDFTQGMVTPAFNWMDPDMKDKSSPYDWGSYWPPEAPTIFMKPVPIKQLYYDVFVNPEYNLPLYELVFHDSVIASDHWLSGSLKIQGEDNTRSLTELLYDVPPLYHLNLDTWNQEKDQISSYYKVWSPVEQKAAELPMTNFSWLTSDLLVQKSIYGDQLEVIANYSDKTYSAENHHIPPQSVLIDWLNSGKTEIYTPHN
ncbi:glycoside hydrolase [Alicyclobacillus suci]|uniref:glycoside hydrolase n=1 Tax=Alicyclobacillus suci TaxID=2816080 RepID=UPI001A8E959C|nr:glycoside hydrolase [Alicyclobacillus suci]